VGGLTLVTGGARAGKTACALALARAHAGPVVYVATAEPGDAEMAARIARHRAERPAAWRTVEAPLDPVGALAGTDARACVVLDCLTLWVSNLLLRALPGEAFTVAEGEAAAAGALAAVEALLAWRERTRTALIAVTNEVGLGIVPASPLARLFRDTLGTANQRAAARAARVLLVVAGLALDLGAAGARPAAAAEADERARRGA
jgi:adenosyl cobinamide kinase/adenosyl cobinamide phosphate guanylyltransferase